VRQVYTVGYPSVSLASCHINVSHLLRPMHDQKNCNSSVRQLAEETYCSWNSKSKNVGQQ